MWAVSVAVAVVFLAPLLWAVVGSFREEAAIFRMDAGSVAEVNTWTLSNYADAWRRSALGMALMVSVAQVVLIVAALLAPDGELKYVHVLAEPRYDKQGACEYLGAVTDVTAAVLAVATSEPPSP